MKCHPYKMFEKCRPRCPPFLQLSENQRLFIFDGYSLCSRRFLGFGRSETGFRFGAQSSGTALRLTLQMVEMSSS